MNTMTLLLALLGSSCCLIQLILNAMSIGCAGFALLDPLSPVFTSLTVVSLSLSLWRVRFRPNRSIAATAALSLFLLSLPSLVDKYNKSNLSHLESTTPKCTVSVTWNIHGLKCLGCAARLKSHLDALDGIEAATVDFSQNEVSVRAPLSARDRTEEEASTLTTKVSDAVASIDFSYILTDYTGDIDLVLSDLESALANNMKVVIGISMAVFVVTVATSCALTYFFTVPLSKITSVVRDATTFDFTAYKRLQKEKYNYIRELGTMEHVFYLMIAKFASSIRNQDTLESASISASVKKGLGSRRAGRDFEIGNAEFYKEILYMQGSETLPPDEHSGSADGIKSRWRLRFCTIPLLAVIFLKTFVMTSFVVVVPLIISFAAMEAANELSTSSGREVAQSLAVQIHGAEASLALERIDSFVRLINEQTVHMYKSISAYGNQSNFDSILSIFANEVKYTGYNLIMYYGRRDDAFLQLEVTAERAIWITTPADYQDPECLICQQLRDSLTRAHVNQATRRNMSAAWADWNQESFKAGNFSFSDQPYQCTKRPWYKQAASLSPDNVHVQYTEPYIFAGGIISSLSGITVNIPFFDSDGLLTGVYGSDITFVDMHKILTEFLQSETAFMYAMTSDGQLIGTSSNETIVDSNGNLIRANESTSPWTRSTAQFLWKLQPSGRKNDFTELDGLRWELEDMSFQLRAMKEAPHFVIVNGALKGDYATTINDLKQDLKELEVSCLHMLVWISAVCFVAVVGMSMSLNYVVIVRPLEQITSVMVHAARLDFTALAKMSQQYRTIIYEISQMETEFFVMVANFADSAKESQGLLRVGAKNAFIFQSSEPGEIENPQRTPIMRKSRFPIPVMIVIFLQSLVFGSIMISAPLNIFFPAMAHSNVYSTSSSRQIVDSLALKIQHVQGHLADETIRSMTSGINQTMLEMRKAISAYSNQASLDSVFEAFEREVQYTKSQLGFLYGHADGAFMSLQQTEGQGVFVALPLNSNYSSCVICAKSQRSFSKADWEPWFAQAAFLDAANARIQYTDPYVYAAGSKENFLDFATGITATYPFFNSSGGLDGVFGLDVTFADIRDSLKTSLQSPNAFIYVATREGILVGTSTNETMLDSAGNLISAQDSKSASIQTTGKYLWNRNLTTNNSDLSTLSDQMLEDQGYLFQLRIMSHAPYFVIVNGAPKTDYTKDIDLVLSDLDAGFAFITKVVVAVSTAVFVLSVVVSNTWTYYFIVLPLSKVTAGLREASNFDFSAYKPLQKQKFNHIREICTMEHVFYMMIAKFAASIRGSNGMRSSTAGSIGTRKTAGSVHEKKGASRMERL
ncbi:hypothetical protein CcCBS67573_g04446 [Chytriomyces confervae]|uniref:HMA domain-containing protein n=1 Tax=Chytriomyces confervae TaxID=246404 RepID=A0A507FEX5_9FUNG|nr:hypothetical protein CcCBS67573_g04446 [Chytriomyces confervae]